MTLRHENTGAMTDQTAECPGSQTRPWRGLVVLLLAVAIWHAPSLFSPFLMDDYVYVEVAGHLDGETLPGLFHAAALDDGASSVWWVPEGALPFYRPLALLSFGLDHAMWGGGPIGFHLTNLALHLLCTAGAWWLGRMLMGTAAGGWAVAVVFALHPCHMEAVAWISGRFDLLVCAFCVASMVAYLHWRRSETWSWSGYLVAGGSMALALLSKETALVLPVAFVGAELILPTRRTHRAFRLTAMGLLVVACVAIYIRQRVLMFGGVAGHLPPPYGLDMSSPTAALGNIALNVALYMLDFVLFVQVEPAYVAAWWRGHPLVLAVALALCLVVVAWCVRVGWRSAAFRFGAFWTVLFAAPSLMAMAGERNVYLASVGVAVMVGAVWQTLVLRSARQNKWGVARWRPGVAALVCLWVVLGLVEQGFMWCIAGTGEKLLRDMQAQLPDPVRGTQIYVINQSPLSSVGFAQAIRLRYGRDDVSGRALTLSPTLLASTVDRVVCLAPRTIRITREGGVFFSSFVERFHLFAGPCGGSAGHGKPVRLGVA